MQIHTYFALNLITLISFYFDPVLCNILSTYAYPIHNSKTPPLFAECIRCTLVCFHYLCKGFSCWCFNPKTKLAFDSWCTFPIKSFEDCTSHKQLFTNYQLCGFGLSRIFSSGPALDLNIFVVQDSLCRNYRELNIKDGLICLHFQPGAPRVSCHDRSPSKNGRS